MRNIQHKHLRDNTKQYDRRKTEKERTVIPPTEE